MRLRDLSLMAADTLMVVIPITVLVLIGAALLGGLRIVLLPPIVKESRFSKSQFSKSQFSKS